MSQNIKKAREIAGLSQKQVALELGVSAPTVSDWESGKICPTAKKLARLAQLLGVSTDYLLGRTDEPTPAAGEPLGPDELEVLNVYRNLNPVGQHELRTLIWFIAGQDRYKKEAAGGPPVA